MQVKHEFTISEIAKIFNIKRETLLYYDKIDLFKADERKENNYRTYSANQLPLLDTIINLRELGLPIKKIKEFTKRRSPSSFSALSDDALKNIREEIRKLKEREELLNSTLREITPAMNAKYDEITIVECPEEKISRGREGDFSSMLFSFDKAYEDFMLSFSVPWTEIAGLEFEIESLNLDDYTTKSRLFSKSGKRKNGIKEEGTYAVMYHKGSWNTLSNIYSGILKEIEAMGFTVTGPCYEEYPIAHLVEEDENNFVTKISIKIERPI